MTRGQDYHWIHHIISWILDLGIKEIIIGDDAAAGDADDKGMLVCRHLCGHRGASRRTALLDIRRPSFDSCDDKDGCTDCHEYENDMNSTFIRYSCKIHIVTKIKQNSSGELMMMMMPLAFLQGTCQLLGTKATPRLSSFRPENLVCHSKYVELVFCLLNLLLFG